jgi:hypothetical protein
MTGGEWHRREKGCVKKSCVRKMSRKTLDSLQKITQAVIQLMSQK